MPTNIIGHLYAVKMKAFTSELEHQIEDTDIYGQLGFEYGLSPLVDCEWNRRKNKRQTQYIINAHFFDFSVATGGIEYIKERRFGKGTMIRFVTGRYVDEGRHVILK